MYSQSSLGKSSSENVTCGEQSNKLWIQLLLKIFLWIWVPDTPVLHVLLWPTRMPGNLCDVWIPPAQKEITTEWRRWGDKPASVLLKIYFNNHLVYSYPVPWAALICRCNGESNCRIWDFAPLLAYLQLHQRHFHPEWELEDRPQVTVNENITRPNNL